MNLAQVYKSHPVFTESMAVQSICKPLEKLGIIYFAHAHLDAEGKLSFMSSCPDFLKTYFDKGFHNYDLHKLNPSTQEQFVLWDALERKEQSKEMHETFMSFNRGHTFSIIQSDGKTKDYYHFAGKLGNIAINDLYLQNIDILKTFILYFKDKIAQFKALQSGYDIKLELPQTGGFLFDNDEDIKEDLKQSLQFDRIYFNGGFSYITKRELECLHWLSLGKTAEEISVILNIAHRTVKAHIVNIREKLDCHNQFQLGLAYANIKNFVDIENLLS